MPFHDAIFHLHVILGDPETPAIWNYSAWSSIADAIDPLLAEARGGPAISTHQVDKNGKSVRFGRIAWNLKGHQKWLHGSPTNATASAGWKFLSLEVWAPGMAVCGREGMPPDVFFAFLNEGFWGAASLTFNPYMVLAVAETITDSANLCENVARNLAEQLNARLHVYQRRPWGRVLGEIGFTNAIGDLMVSSVFKPGPTHKLEPSLDILQGDWEKR